jgi:hypothetical protein
MPQAATKKAVNATSSTASHAIKSSKPDFPKAFAKAAADTLKKAPPKAKASSAAIRPKNEKSRDLEYKNLIDPKTQDQRKAQHLQAFEKLKTLSIQDLQVEFIVCIRAGKATLVSDIHLLFHGKFNIFLSDIS